MGKRLWTYAILVWVLAACASNRGTPSSGPRLVAEATLEPTTPVPTRILSPTPSPIVIPVSTSEVVSPLEIVTVDADFVLVTPTLPPSKTPTQTPTHTPTHTQTPTPTVTVTATATAPQLPTSVVVPATAIVAQPQPQVCDSTWFFIQPRPASCPVSAALASQGTFQQFENGYMIWVQQQDAIYVLYNSATHPRWQVFNDPFEEGTPERDPNIVAPPQTWQPRRGFGEIWRQHPEVRQRIGWAVQEWETIYSVQVQTATDGTIFILEPRGGIFSLAPGGRDWQRYENAGIFRQ